MEPETAYMAEHLHGQMKFMTPEDQMAWGDLMPTRQEFYAHLVLTVVNARNRQGLELMEEGADFDFDKVLRLLKATDANHEMRLRKLEK